MKARINYLLKQYFYNKSSREELDELFAVIQSAKYDTEIAELIKELYDNLKQQDPSLTYVNGDGQLLDLQDWATGQSGIPVETNVKEKGRRWRLYAAVASAAALLLVGFFYGQRRRTYEPKEQVLVIKQVAGDENKVLTLADGSKVWINSSSRLEYPQEFKKGQAREVTLVGEAYFEIERAEDWPFIVHTGDVSTKVLGTKFNVKAYPEMKDILVTVKTGKVMVTKQDRRLATLTKGEELRVPVLESLVTESIRERTLQSKVAGSWTVGYLDYEDEEIATIVTDLERHFGISIQLQRKDLDKKMITLSVEKNMEPTAVLGILTTLTDTDFKKSNNNYVIF
ncbi:FecR family protein [Sphingobacterium sp. SYP-B4668]|uniref:FecR family protein n=1 Tax=Sphingobacterium sp. SYP-B4668 TaxID=2996035 RepID=UPI0022DCEAA8|nr:FecR domain-containing protein [Sphingobacterium sp. SYP-B4668]